MLAVADAATGARQRATVAFWRNRDTLPSVGQRLRNTRWATNGTGAGIARPPRATAETCTALTCQRGAVARRNLIRLRKQKLLRQVFERLQDRLLCTFLKAD